MGRKTDVDRDYEANVPLLRRTMPLTRTSIDRSRVQKRYDAAALAISRIRSDEINGDGDDLDLLPYYEGKRDALRELLEPVDAD